MLNIPEDFIDFLYWIKESTEKLWSEDLEISGCEEWIHGAKWIGMNDAEIDEIVNKYSVRFTAEHRAFLRILHTLDRKKRYEYTESCENNVEIIIEETSFFHNWLDDQDYVITRLSYPFETILYDVNNHSMWLNSWDKKPDSEDKKREIFAKMYKRSPQLLPIHAHRFLVSDPSLKHNPVLSIWGADTIVYGWTLRTYLLNELKTYLDIFESVYNEGDQKYYSEVNNEAQEIFDDDFKYDETKVIPFWQEIILQYNQSWKSFGMESPINRLS